jgi:hypothetical protein
MLGLDTEVSLVLVALHAAFLYDGYERALRTGAVDNNWLVPVLAPIVYLRVLGSLTAAMETREAFAMRGAMAVYNAYSTALSLVMFVLFARELASVPPLEVWTSASSGRASAVFWVATQSKYLEFGARAGGRARARRAPDARSHSLTRPSTPAERSRHIHFRSAEEEGADHDAACDPPR